jgi:uncharacterized protein (DUF3820 family)
MIMRFGVHKGKRVDAIEDKYLIWIVKTDRGDYGRGFNGHRPPIGTELAAEARSELKKRGYEFKGSRIEKEPSDGRD